jgi:hypothetical protein
LDPKLELNFALSILDLNNRRVIQFDEIFNNNQNQQKESGVIQVGYADLNWSDFKYLHISYASRQDQCMLNASYPVNSPNRIHPLHINAFTQGQEYVASCTVSSSTLPTIESPERTFNIHSFDANTINPLAEIAVKGLRNNIGLYMKTVFLTNNSTTITLEWLNIDQIQFQSTRTGYNVHMCISRLTIS